MSEQWRMHVDVNLDRVRMGLCKQQRTLSLLNQAMVNRNTVISASIIHHRNHFSHKSFPCPCRSEHDTVPLRHANYQSPVNWSTIFSRKAVFFNFLSAPCFGTAGYFQHVCRPTRTLLIVLLRLLSSSECEIDHSQSTLINWGCLSTNRRLFRTWECAHAIAWNHTKCEWGTETSINPPQTPLKRMRKPKIQLMK